MSNSKSGIIYVFAKDGKIKCVDSKGYYDLRGGQWVHTATLSGAVWMTHFLNSSPNEQAIEIKMLKGETRP